MKPTAEELAALFEVTDVVDSTGEDEEFDILSENKNSQTFEQKAKDLQLIVEKEAPDIMEKENKTEEEQIKSDKSVILNAAKNAKNKTETPKIIEQKIQDDTPPFDVEPEKEIEDETEDEEIEEKIEEKPVDFLEEENDPLIKRSEDNPLNLIGKELENYKELKELYGDRFVFSDNSSYMDQFFRYKAKEIGFLIAKSEIIDCDSVVKEMKNINLKHSVEGFPSGNVIVRKLNDVMRQRERLSSLMVDLHAQYHLWETSVEMMKGKLWCVKDVKGQHKREGLVMDYMSDVIHYVSDLRRSIETGKYIENMLISSWESLSRQLSCIQESQKRDSIEYLDELDEATNKSDTCDIKKDKKRIQKMPELNVNNAGDDLAEIG